MSFGHSNEQENSPLNRNRQVCTSSVSVSLSEANVSFVCGMKHGAVGTWGLTSCCLLWTRPQGATPIAMTFFWDKAVAAVPWSRTASPTQRETPSLRPPVKIQAPGQEVCYIKTWLNTCRKCWIKKHMLKVKGKDDAIKNYWLTDTSRASLSLIRAFFSVASGSHWFFDIFPALTHWFEWMRD